LIAEIAFLDIWKNVQYYGYPKHFFQISQIVFGISRITISDIWKN